MTRELEIMEAIGRRLRDLVVIEHALPARLQKLVQDLHDKEPRAAARAAEQALQGWREQMGGCLCGDVRFRLKAEPHNVGYCHCHSCRKHTGAPVSVFADCKRAAVEFTKGQRRLYESSPGVHRGFCSRCGSTLTYELVGEVHVHIGALDRPEDFPPSDEPSFPEERVAWLDVATHRKQSRSD